MRRFLMIGLLATATACGAAPEGASWVDQVVADSPLLRCEEQPSLTSEPTVDGPISSEPRVARVQRLRAERGLSSDEDTARALADDPEADLDSGWGAVTAEESEAMARGYDDILEPVHAYLDEHRDTYGFSLIDRSGGGTYVVGFTDDLEGHRRRLAEQFPDIPTRVVQAPATKAQLYAAVDRMSEVDTRHPQIRGAGIGTDRVHIVVTDPTSMVLEDIAAAVDPAFTCLEVTETGMSP